MSIFVSYIPDGAGTSTRTGIDCQKLSDSTCGKRAARLAGEDPDRPIGRLPTRHNPGAGFIRVGCGAGYRHGGPAGAVLLFPLQGFDEGDDVLDVLRGNGELGDERRNFRAPGYAGHLDEYRVRGAPVKRLQALHVIRQFGEKPERRGTVDAGERVVADHMASNAVLVRQFPAFFGVAGPGAGRKNEGADGQGNGKGQASNGPNLPLSSAGANTEGLLPRGLGEHQLPERAARDHGIEGITGDQGQPGPVIIGGKTRFPAVDDGGAGDLVAPGRP